VELTRVKTIDGLACIGPANGMRDPIILLNVLQQPPQELILNDISSEMLREAYKNLVIGNWDKKINVITTVHNPIANVENICPSIRDRNTSFCFGVYSADNMYDALRIYSTNTDRLGFNFKLRTIIYDERLPLASLSQVNEFEFDIRDYEKVMDKVNCLRATKGFYAFGVVTEKNFVSHYFDSRMLNRILDEIFRMHTVQTYTNINGDKRYITAIIRSMRITGRNYMVTMLNNVLGNIKMDEQLLSLRKINIFFS
jgi:hypothetical protein